MTEATSGDTAKPPLAKSPLEGVSKEETYVTHKIWDVTVRLFHWSFAVLILLMWVTAEQGNMELHRKLGLAIVALLVYRIYWGFAGPVSARFKDLPLKPSQILKYIPKLKSKNYIPYPGHNPLASLSVLAMLGAVLFQVSTGLFSIDTDGLESGPLATFVSFEQGQNIAGFHKTNFNIVLGLIILHLSAIAYYALGLSTDLVSTMITGKRELKETEAGENPKATANIAKVIPGLVLAGAAVWAILHFGA